MNHNGKIEKEMQELLICLKPLERTKILRWEESNILPIQKWDTSSKRKLATKKDNHLVLVLIDEFLQNSGNEWQNLIAEALQFEKERNTIVLPIWINSFLKSETLNFFDNKPILPNRRKSLHDMDDRDGALLSIVNEIKKQLNKSR